MTNPFRMTTHVLKPMLSQHHVGACMQKPSCNHYFWAVEVCRIRLANAALTTHMLSQPLVSAE